MDVKMVACTPTLEMTGLTKADLIEGVEVGGAADYLDFGPGCKYKPVCLVNLKSKTQNNHYIMKENYDG